MFGYSKNLNQFPWSNVNISLDTPNLKTKCFKALANKSKFRLQFRSVVNRANRRGAGLDHGCQMAVARFLDHMCLALGVSGPWIRYATLLNLIPSFPWIAPKPSILAQSKERKGSNFSMWQP